MISHRCRRFTRGAIASLAVGAGPVAVRAGDAPGQDQPPTAPSDQPAGPVETKRAATDDLRAAPLLERSAAAGDIDAAHQLGDLYLGGGDVVRDDAKALTYYLQAAEGGSLADRASAAVFYTNGRGTARDYVKGLAWSIVAKPYGLDFGYERELRTFLAPRHPEHVAAAEQAAVELIRKIDERLK